MGLVSHREEIRHRESGRGRGRWPVRGRHEVVEEVRGTDYGRNWL